MGLAVMVVVYGHLLYYYSGLQNYESLNFTEWYTLGSVEMFVFLSGFGVYQSLRRNRDSFSFYGRRLARILPAFLPAIFCWTAFGVCTGDLRRVGEIVGNLTGLGWWYQLPNQFNWYVPAILLFYLLAPVLYDCLERLGKKWIWVMIFLFIGVMAGFRSNLLMSTTRLPTYYLGMYFGKRYADGTSPSKKEVWIWTAVGVAAMAIVPYFFLIKTEYLWHYGMYWILFFFSTPACMFWVTKLLDVQERWAPGRALNRVWRFLGARSFEIYLCHLVVYSIWLRLGAKGKLTWICIAIIGTCLGIVYHELVNWCLKCWKQKKAA